MKILFKYIKTLLLITLFLVQSLVGQQSKIIEITWSSDINLRNLADVHLGNPDLWPTILSFNNISSVSELKEGRKLKVPQKEVLNALNIISEVEKKISKAIDNGSKIFAKVETEKALLLLKSTLEFRSLNNWVEAIKTAKEALIEAENALNKTLDLRDQSADAYISKKKGTVQNKKPNVPGWNNASLFEKLFELDLTRTLSSSFAEITFTDLNQIRLNENSQAVILKSRINLLNNKTQSQIRLQKGDAYAKLFNTPKKQFDLSVEGVKLNINSELFWVDKQDIETKVANYKGDISLESKGKSVLLKENQGSTIPTGGSPTDPKNLLPSPTLISPNNLSKLYDSDITISWSQIDGAAEYWIEIALESRFSSLYQIVKNVKGVSYTFKNLPPNIYYWRIASVDEHGLPGKFSNHFIFMFESDVTPPFLEVSPIDNFIVTKENKITFSIKTESNVRLLINNSEINIDSKGNSMASVSLNDGLNKIEIIATDNTGNKTSTIKEVFAEPVEKVEFTDENKNPISEVITLSKNKTNLSGYTRPYSSVKIKSLITGMETSTYADNNGFFTISLPRLVVKDELNLNIITRAGYSLTKKILFD